MKLSIRIYEDREVRAIWDNENSKWWFSVLDVIGVLNQQDDYSKNRNYWKYLKTKLRREENEVVSATNQLKMLAPDGKMRLTDVLDSDGITKLAKSFPNTRASKFLDWFTYSESTVDGKSRKKAYTLFESGLLDSISQSSYDEIIGKYVEMNIAHPFREGNGRATRIWLDLMLKSSLGLCVDWSQINKNQYLEAMTSSVTDDSVIRNLLKPALTDKINDREMFMKGIDYSYYYEEAES